MTDLQLIDSLIDLVMQEADLIRQLAYELKQRDALSKEMAADLQETDDRIMDILEGP